MSRRTRLLLVVGALLLIGAGLWMLTHRQPRSPREMIGGGDGGGLPRASPLDERIDGTALERAVQVPAAQGLQAFVVMRDGHLVFERYGAGVSAQSMIDGANA